MFPDFLGIGAQKAGTTWLYANLKKHPDLWLPPIKELHYFNYRQDDYMQNPIDKFKSKYWQKIFWEQINSAMRDKDLAMLKWNLRYFLGRQNDEWYASLFEPGKGKVKGEITPDYTALDKSFVSHIHTIMPGTKLIFMLRNPIERAWSYTFSHIKMDGKTVDSIPVKTLINRCTNNNSRMRGNNKRVLEIWQSYYPEEQFFIGFFEEVKECPADLLFRVCEFLSVEASSEFIQKIDTRKVYSFGNTGDIPDEVRLELARIYYDEIKYLSLKYGGYASAWLDYADECLSCS